MFAKYHYETEIWWLKKVEVEGACIQVIVNLLLTNLKNISVLN